MPASASRLPCVCLCLCVCVCARGARESLPFMRERANKRKRMRARAFASREQAESRPAFCVHKRGKSRPALSAQRRPASQRAPCPSYGTLCESGHSISPITRKDGGDLSRFDKTIRASRMCESRHTAATSRPPAEPGLFWRVHGLISSGFDRSSETFRHFVIIICRAAGTPPEPARETCTV